MFGDILKEDESSIVITIPKKTVDEMFAMHGEFALQSIGDVSAQLIMKSVDLQIAYNLKNNENYYDILRKEILEKLLKEKEESTNEHF